MISTELRPNPSGGRRQSRWQQAVDWPLTIAALVFLVAYSITVIAEVDVTTADVLRVVIVVSWALFPVSYIVEIALAAQPWQWVLRHPVNLLFVLMPLLRPLRLLRVVAHSRVFQQSAGTAFRARVLVYLAGAAVLVSYIAALAVLEAERGDPTANITSFGDSLWWAAVTITTVGYGDYTPVTVRGRSIATGLMLGGVAVLGVLTATLSSWIVQRVAGLEAERHPRDAGLEAERHPRDAGLEAERHPRDAGLEAERHPRDAGLGADGPPSELDRKAARHPPHEGREPE